MAGHAALVAVNVRPHRRALTQRVPLPGAPFLVRLAIHPPARQPAFSCTSRTVSTVAMDRVLY